MNGPYVLLALLLLVLFLILRRRPRVAMSDGEGMAVLAFAVLGTLQASFEHQVQFDDFVFTPLYLAVPVWLGAARGPAQGVAGTILGVGALYFVASLHPLGLRGAVASQGATDGLLMNEWAVAVILLPAIAGIAGGLRRWWPVIGWLPLLWGIFFVAVHSDILLNFASWIVLTLAVFVTTTGLALMDAGFVAIPPDRPRGSLRAERTDVRQPRRPPASLEDTEA